MTPPRPKPDGSRVTPAALRYARLGPTGFLNARHCYTTVVRGEEMFRTACRRDCKRNYFKWLNLAPNWHIQLMRDGQPINERKPLCLLKLN